MRIDAGEEVSRHTQAKAAPARTASELLHELLTHKIELERQNVELRRAQLALEESRDRFVDLYEFAPVGYITLDETGLIIESNLTGTMLLQLERRKLLHGSFDRFVAPEDRDRWRCLFASVMKHGGRQELEIFLRRGDGSTFLAHLDCRHMQLGDASPEVRITFSDRPEHRKAEDALKLYKQVVDTAMDGFWMVDAQGNLQEANEAYAKMSGYSMDELVNMNISQLEVREKSREADEAQVAMVVAQGSGRFEARHRHKDGHEFEVEVSATCMAESGKLFVFCHDITKRKAAEEKIRNMAFYDALTQLPNRRMLSDRMAQAMASSKRSGCYGALMFIDMDNFKPLNDAHGHNVGDLLLVQVARRIVSCVREMDTVTRFGGDEFVVMLRELYVDEAESIAQSVVVAEKISAILAEPYVLKIQNDGNTETTVTHHCTSSIGIVLFTSQEASQNDIIKWADMAMYQAKSDGRNLIRFFGQQG